MINMEVCANSVASALAAAEGGAIRVELCDNLLEGGTTPSYAQIWHAKEMLSIPVFPIIRPRGGDFLYSDLEFEIMKTEIKMCRSLHCEGVVFGILTADGHIDMARCEELIDLAGPMSVTFHRAFDRSCDLKKSLEDIIYLGCSRLLTSGGAATAYEGIETITALNKQASGRIIIMPGAGISVENIEKVIQHTGVREFHSTAKRPVNSEMKFRNNKALMGAVADEFSWELTDSKLVSQLIQLANK
jgi:copper homeostasis protein